MTNDLAVAEGLEPSNFRINSPALYQLSYATICDLCFDLRHSQQVWTGREAGMPLGTPRSQTVGHSVGMSHAPIKKLFLIGHDHFSILFISGSVWASSVRPQCSQCLGGRILGRISTHKNTENTESHRGSQREAETREHHPLFCSRTTFSLISRSSCMSMKRYLRHSERASA